MKDRKGVKSYNDYVELTRGYLRNYYKLKIAMENLEDDIKATRARSSPAAAIAMYGDKEGGLTELSTTEQGAETCLRTGRRVGELQIEVDNIARTLDKLDKALNALEAVDRELVIGHYRESMPWSFLGDRFAYSEKTARVRGGKALQDLALMLFGVKAMQTSFVFV